MDLAEAIITDRERRKEGNRKALSRAKYGELVGMTEQRVWALDHGKKNKPGELEKLMPYLGDLLTSQPAPEQAPTLNNESRPPGSAEDDYAAERRGLEAAYAYVLQRAHGKEMSGAPWPSTHRIDSCAPADFPAIRAWIQREHEWMDGVGDAVLEEPQKSGGVSYSDDEDLYDDAVAYLQPGEKVLPRDVHEKFQDPSKDPELRIDGLPPEPEPEVEHTIVHLEFDPELRYFTNSEIKTFKQCRRKWWLGYYRNLGVKSANIVGAASVGTRVHRVLQEYYVPQGAKRRDPWDVFNQTVADDKVILDEIEADETLRAKWSAEVDLARAIIDGYFDWAEENAVDAGLMITAPEETMVANPQFPDQPNVRLLAKLDVRATRTLDNARVFLDHKTVMDLTTPQKTLHLDEQMLHYHLIEFFDLKEKGLDTEMRTGGALYNMLRKVKRTGNAKPPFYGRVEVHHNQETLRSYWLRLKGTISEILKLQADLEAGKDPREVAYPNPTRDCTWKCEFFAVCPMFDDGSRVDDFIGTYLTETDPLARYGKEADA